jgi:hypothetical protein
MLPTYFGNPYQKLPNNSTHLAHLRALTQAGLEEISKALQGTDIRRILVGDTASSPYFQVQRLEF